MNFKTKEERVRKKISLFGFLLIFIWMVGTKAQVQRNNQFADTTNVNQSTTTNSITKLERVEWSGIHLLGLRAFGHWLPVDKGTSFFGLYLGSNTPYFRINGKDNTIFRGLGRENNFLQVILPTSHSRKVLRDFIGTNNKALGYLGTFDNQIGTGEKIYMVSKAASIAGEAMFYSGLFLSTVTYNINHLKKLSIPGAYMWLIGILGKFIGSTIEEKAFAFLDRAVEEFNTSQSKGSALPSDTSHVSVRGENNRSLAANKYVIPSHTSDSSYVSVKKESVYSTQKNKDVKSAEKSTSTKCTLFGAFSLPSGDFASDNIYDENSGWAKNGFGLGFDMSIPLGSPGWNFIVSLSYIRNGTSGDTENEVQKEWESYLDTYLFYVYDVYYADVSVTASIDPWENVPIMGGLKYRTSLSPTVSFYAMGMAGINVVIAGVQEIKADAEWYDEWFDYNELTIKQKNSFHSATAMCFSIGGGILLNNQINIGLRYFNLGKANIKGKTEIRYEHYDETLGTDISRESYDIKLKKPISVVLLTFGINF